MRVPPNKWRDVFISTKTGDLLNEVTLRLIRPTCRHRPGYKIVACHGPGQRTCFDDERESSVIEEVGFFDDCVNEKGTRICLLDISKIRQYIADGAEPTMPVWKLLGASGVFPVHPRVYAIAAQNQYLQEVIPDANREAAGPISNANKTFTQPAQRIIPLDLASDYAKERNTTDYEKILSEDRRNREKGLITAGQYKQIVKKLGSRNTTPITRRVYEQMFVKAFWDLNRYDNSGRGEHGNWNRAGYDQKKETMARNQYGYWSRGIRNKGITDPFQLVQKPVIHREDENTKLLRETNPA